MFFKMYVGSQYPWLPSTPQLRLCHATLAHYAASTGLLSAPPTRLFFAHATFTAFHSAPVMSQQKRLSPFLISHPIPRFLYDCSPFLPHYSISSRKAGLAHLHVKGRRRCLSGSVREAPQASLNGKSRQCNTHQHPSLQMLLLLSSPEKRRTRFC